MLSIQGAAALGGRELAQQFYLFTCSELLPPLLTNTSAWLASCLRLKRCMSTNDTLAASAHELAVRPGPPGPASEHC
jgi:hypothetical protein